MKKVLLSLLAACGMAFGAWAGDGTEASPYSVAEVIQKYNANNSIDEAGVYVQGYIVGSMADANSTNLNKTTFGASPASNTNIVLAGSSTETDYQFCLAVQLPNNEVRTPLSLQQNPNNLGHQVLLKGRINKYCGAQGLRDTSFYEWIGEAPIPGGGNTGGGSTDDGYLTGGLDPFTIDNVNLPEELTFVWQWDNAYGAKASAHYNDTDYAAESYLISPEITLAADAKSATFSQALNFLNGNNRADYVNVVVRENNGAWQTVNVSAWPAGSDWGFVDNCEIDLSAYAGKTIQLAFHYKSSTTCAPTWEVKRLVIGGTTPETPDAPSGDKVTFDFTNPASLGFAVGDATEFDLTGKSTTSGIVSMSFAGEGASTPIRLFSSNGNWTFRFYNNTSFTVSVPSEYHITGIEFNGTNLGTDWDYSNGSLTGNLWSPSGSVSSVSIYKTNTGNNPTIKTITVYYAEGAGEDTGGDKPSVEAMTVAEGLAWLDAGNSGKAIVKGYITSIKEISTDFGNATYYIGDDVDSSSTITVYRGYYLNGDKFTSQDQIKVGDFVVVEGNLELYGNYKEPEFTTGNKIISIGDDAVDGIVIDSAEAVYFNLQGVRVAHPERGIFVKVQGGKTSKVLVK